MTAQPRPSEFEIAPNGEVRDADVRDAEVRAAQRIVAAHRLVEMGMELAEAAQRLALARMEREIAALEAGDVVPGEEEDAAGKGRRSDPLAAAERMARMVRLSLALAARLDGDEPVRRARFRSDAAAEREAEADALRRTRDAERMAELVEASLREDSVFEVVEATLKAAGMERGEVQEWVADIQERMAEAEREGEWEYDYVRRPVGAVIAKICEALDPQPDWTRWAGEDWALEEAATNAEGSPYARGGAAWVKRAAAEPADAPPEEAACEPVPPDGSSP